MSLNVVKQREIKHNTKYTNYRKHQATKIMYEALKTPGTKHHVPSIETPHTKNHVPRTTTPSTENNVS